MNIFVTLLAIHLVAAAFMVGGVFMNVVIVWPAARETLGKAEFPLEFLAMEGRRIAPWIYSGLALVLASGLGLLLWAPPDRALRVALAVAKAALFLVMLGNTLYGTRNTWPALMVSSGGDEAARLWKGYAARARVTLACGVAAIVISALQRL